MRNLKLFIAVGLTGAIFAFPAKAAGVSSENQLVFTPTSTVDENESFSGAVSSPEPDLAALRLTPAVTNGVPFTPTVILPEASSVPEPGGMMLAAIGAGLLLRSRRQR